MKKIIAILSVMALLIIDVSVVLVNNAGEENLLFEDDELSDAPEQKIHEELLD